MKAFLKNYRQSPRKVRLLADLVRGRKVTDALVELDFANKRAGLALQKLIKSAAANAKHTKQLTSDDLFIKNITVDEGVVLKRFQPVSRGSAHRIRKRTSRVSIILDTKK